MLEGKSENLKKGKKVKIKHLGSRLRAWRKSVPMKSFELAKALSVSQGSLSDIENNKSLPSAETITALYINTNLDIIWMLTGEKKDDQDRSVPETDEDTLTFHIPKSIKNIIIGRE